MKTLRFLALILFLSTALSACSASASRGKTYPVTPALREYYNTLGGKDLLGPAISKEFTFNGNSCQYAVSVLMCADPTGRSFLSPLGRSLAASQAASEQTASDASLVVNGIPVYSEFIPLYKELTGASIVGYPLARARMNYSQQRVEQYFENIGFYRNFSDDASKVHLLAYGAAACSDRCDYTPAIDAVISTSTVPETDRVFLEGLEKIGAGSIFGKPLTRAFLAADGSEEQVFENAALYTAANSRVIHLRAVPLTIGITPSPPGTKLYGTREGMVFYATQDGLGYHVPVLFDEFISSHGGTAISGMPIMEVTEVSAGMYRQCFENYCILYSPANSEEQQLSLEPLGADYLSKISPADLYGDTVVISPSTVSLKMVGKFTVLQPGQIQTLTLSLHSQVDDRPLAGIESELKVIKPDGKYETYPIPATLASGESSVTVPFLKRIPNGSVIRYQVCLTGIIAQPVCADGSYVQMKLP